MWHRRKWGPGELTFLLLAGCGLVAFLALLLLLDSRGRELRNQEKRVVQLVQLKAHKSALASVFVTNCVSYVKGTVSWEDFALRPPHEPRFAHREDRDRYLEFRQGLTKWPAVLFYSPQRGVTWCIFLDEQDRVVQYHLNVQ